MIRHKEVLSKNHLLKSEQNQKLKVLMMKRPGIYLVSLDHKIRPLSRAKILLIEIQHYRDLMNLNKQYKI